jgi:hypothetical protein
LEELTPGANVAGLVPGEAVEVVASRWAGSRSLVLTYRSANGRVDEQIVYRDAEPSLELVGWRGDLDVTISCRAGQGVPVRDLRGGNQWLRPRA